MYKNVNGKLIEMTEAEIAEEKQKIQISKAEEKSRPLTAEEVTARLIRQQINGLTVDDNTALRMKAVALRTGPHQPDRMGAGKCPGPVDRNL